MTSIRVRRQSIDDFSYSGAHFVPAGPESLVVSTWNQMDVIAGEPLEKLFHLPKKLAQTTQRLITRSLFSHRSHLISVDLVCDLLKRPRPD